jgi:hypothetical protein
MPERSDRSFYKGQRSPLPGRPPGPPRIESEVVTFVFDIVSRSKGESKPKQHKASSARTKPQTTHSAKHLKSKLSRRCQNKAKKADTSKTYPRGARPFSLRVSGAHPAGGDVVTNDVGREEDEMQPAISGHTWVLGLLAHVLTTCAKCIYCLNHVLIRRVDLA